MKANGAAAKSPAIAWLVMLTITVVGLAGGAAGQQGCASTFFAVVQQLMPCRPAVTPFSQAMPSEECCDAIRMLGQPCLCVLMSGPPIFSVDRSVAIQLPGKCSVDFQPCSV